MKPDKDIITKQIKLWPDHIYDLFSSVTQLCLTPCDLMSRSDAKIACYNPK